MKLFNLLSTACLLSVLATPVAFGQPLPKNLFCNFANSMGINATCIIESGPYKGETLGGWKIINVVANGPLGINGLYQYPTKTSPGQYHYMNGAGGMTLEAIDKNK